MNKKSNRKEKWRNTPLTSQNIDEYMRDLIDDTKGQYITQGVSFNKDDSLQMNLLKQAILRYGSFSGLVKQLLTNHFDGSIVDYNTRTIPVAAKPEEVIHVSEEKHVATQEIKTPSSPIVSSAPSTPKREEAIIKQPEKKRFSPNRKSGGGSSFQANPNALPPKGSPY